jgi:hypothetical protein
MPKATSTLRSVAFTNPLALSALAVTLVAAAVLVQGDGLRYYGTPLGVRAYQPAHRLLRPSGAVGQALGVAGLVMMLVPVAYAVRKRWSPMARAGSMKSWLDVHIFCGMVGPALVTFHTSFKFNGIVSVAYWSMVIVVLSGVIGRYLYVRIPRSLRGAELSYAEIEARAAGLMADVAAAGVPASDLERAATGWGAAAWLERRRTRRRLVERGLDRATADRVLALASERALLLRRLTHLARTRRLFALWHVFHLPLVYLMFAIVIAHVGLAWYLGYASFLQR